MIHRLYCHIVWTTRGREPLIDAGLARFLCAFLRGVAGQERTQILEIGMVRTHVHLVVRLHPTTRLDRLLQRLKGGSAAIAGKERHSTEGPSASMGKGLFDTLRERPECRRRSRVPARSADAPPGRGHSRLERYPARIRRRGPGRMEVGAAAESVSAQAIGSDPTLQGRG